MEKRSASTTLEKAVHAYSGIAILFESLPPLADPRLE
jgi:hypothetical protein